MVIKRLLNVVMWVSLSAATAAQAHHSLSGVFDITRSFEIDGLVSRVDWMNPHVYVYVNGKGANGKPMTYRLESLPVAMMRKAGLSKTSLLGDGKPVKVHAYPARAGTPDLGYMLTIKFADGREIQFSKIPRGGIGDTKMNIRICTALVVLGVCLSAVAADAPPATPRTADGHPDFNGVWDNGGGIDFLNPQKLPDGSVCVTGCAPPAATAAPAAPAGTRPPPDRPRYKPELAAKVSDLDAKQVKFDPVLRCQPPGVPRIGPPDKIVQTAREMVFLYEDVSGPFFRIVPLVPGVVRVDDSPSYLGDAAGHWEGDTLVVETVNFNDLTWLADNGAFHSEALKVTERLTRRGSQMEYSAVVQDPGVLAEPWNMRPRRMTLMDKEMAEPAPCIDQDLHLMQDDSHHANPR